MTIDILTIFPEMFSSVLSASILGRARQAGLIEIEATDIRPFSASKHKNTDDYPFGGGAGMLMMAQPIADAMKAVTQPPFCGKRIFLGPKGKKLTQELAQELCKLLRVHIHAALVRHGNHDARALGHGRERIVGKRDGQACLLREQFVQPAELRAAAGKHYAAVHKVRRQFRRAVSKSDSNGFADA